MRVLAVAVGLVLWLCAAPAQAQQVRLAAPSDCLANPGCGVGLRSVYGLEVRSVFVPLTVSDAGIGALDDGLAEVAVAFSSNPQVSRPDIRTLRDDRRMVHRDRVVPVVRRRLLRAYGAADARVIRARLNAASAALSTLALRGLNQAVNDGRLPEAVGGEFIDANGLSVGSRRRHGPRIDIGFMGCAENETLAHLYGEALRGAGFRVRVRSIGGLRPAAVSQLRRDRLDLYPDYDGSLLRYLVGTSPARLRAGLAGTLARIDAEPMRLSRAEDRNVFVMKSALAAQLGITKLSDLRRYWQTARS
jgi:glycine betaine/choline ABC-type transport system substrate-binding protein